jgi:hypothetical protein
MFNNQTKDFIKVMQREKKITQEYLELKNKITTQSYNPPFSNKEKK